MNSRRSVGAITVRLSHFRNLNGSRCLRRRSLSFCIREMTESHRIAFVKGDPLNWLPKQIDVDPFDALLNRLSGCITLTILVK